jgi:hypothetical protein
MQKFSHKWIEQEVRRRVAAANLFDHSRKQRLEHEIAAAGRSARSMPEASASNSIAASHTGPGSRH